MGQGTGGKGGREKVENEKCIVITKTIFVGQCMNHTHTYIIVLSCCFFIVIYFIEHASMQKFLWFNRIKIVFIDFG